MTEKLLVLANLCGPLIGEVWKKSKF